MKKHEVKRTIEQVIRTEYIAEDGAIFYNEEECKKYEDSALFSVSHKLKRLSRVNTSIYDLLEEGSEECDLEIFDIPTESDLENLRRYVYLKASKHGAREKDIQACFTSEDGIKRKDYVFDNVTSGHEVMVFWTYDNDWFWVYKDGSLNGYFEWLKDKYAKITTPDKDKGV